MDIPFEDMWKEFYRVIKKNRMIAIFCNQPYTTRLINSNIKDFQYNLYWKHGRYTNISSPNPVNILEEIAIFGGHYLNKDNKIIENIIDINYGPTPVSMYQKPVELCEHLIKLYTKEGDTVLDCFAGSGSTGIAARNLNRSYILVEKDEKVYQQMIERLNKLDNNC